ncbi:Zinc finger CONSTANS-LIKE 16 -like protein [Gossypium arboreum]|uniref:Zinc finger CONSTANS-LIKE 16-like protein n=1 Tax=Gossypium arboreum TaxID=29729 RepID=A0A0B0PK89_GOSAR|nr:Zinc finger CONSTANS-LIKE 16 -like protein [Gossypium arboreum]
MSSRVYTKPLSFFLLFFRMSGLFFFISMVNHPCFLLLNSGDRKNRFQNRKNSGCRIFSRFCSGGRADRVLRYNEKIAQGLIFTKYLPLKMRG